jgi:hypothetical protein
LEYAKEEKEIREENLRLQRRLQLEMERREALCRHLSESESSLEMEEERVYNELSHATGPGGLATPTGAQSGVHRTRTVSSPVPVVGGLGQTGPSPSASITSNSRPLSPGLNYGEGNTLQRRESGHTPLFTPPTIMHGRVHSLTTPPGGPGMLVGVPSPSPPPGPAGLPPSRGRGHPNPPILPPTTNKTS